MTAKYSQEALEAIHDVDAARQPDAHDAVEELIASARADARQHGTKYCMECGAPLEGSGRFCMECGTRAAV